MAKKEKVLKDHKKVGSTFIPPMMQLPNWKEISYINQILPEIIWMGLINDKFGYRSGIDLLSKIATPLQGKFRGTRGQFRSIPGTPYRNIRN